jgi:hypothetical protein
MTKEELRDYCYSIGLIDTKLPAWAVTRYTKGYRFPNEFVNTMDYIVGWDEEKECVVVANACVINEAFVNEGPIRMDGSSVVQNDEEIKAHIDYLIKSVQENIKLLKCKQMKKKIKIMEGDFE